MNETDQIAAFIARKGITRVAEGTSNGMSRRDWYDTVRAPKAAKPMAHDIRIVKAIDHLGRSVIVNGDGELVAIG
jgi:hypothetical protein